MNIYPRYEKGENGPMHKGTSVSTTSSWCSMNVSHSGLGRWAESSKSTGIEEMDWSEVSR